MSKPKTPKSASAVPHLRGTGASTTPIKSKTNNAQIAAEAAAEQVDEFATDSLLESAGAVSVADSMSVTGMAALNSQVLVLNKMWMAIRVIDAKRALTLLFKDIAEVIRVDDGSFASYGFDTWSDVSAYRDQHNVDSEAYDWVNTVRFQIAVPKIIRLVGYDKLPKQEVKLNRRNIYARDHNICQYCGNHFPTSELSLDHVNPRSQGGENSWTNLVCCCVKCNAKKGGRTPEQARMKLIRKPVRPNRNPAIAVRLGSEKYASWKHFLDNAYWSVELR